MKYPANLMLCVGILVDALLIALSFINDGFIGLAVSCTLLIVYSVHLYYKTK